jgi:hypothetical protein
MLVIPILSLGAALAPPIPPPLALGVCRQTARLAARAASHELREDLLIELAKCANLEDPEEREDCRDEAWEEFFEGVEEAGAQYEARIDICGLLDVDRYDPEIDPESFSSVIDNPLLPFLPGTRWTYEEQTEGESEVIIVTVLDETKEILGVECRVVRDVAMVGDELIEDTLDYYAQDAAGNVWYFGELSLSFEDGELESLEGSWKSGVDGAKPGIVMFASPTVGTSYRQEFLLGEAEDAATVLALDEVVSVPFGMFRNCVETADFTPLEPDVLEHKYYAPGIGLVLEVDVETGERVELVDLQMP